MKLFDKPLLEHEEGFCIVQFENGKYGVKNKWGSAYYDLAWFDLCQFTWSRGDSAFADCQANYWRARQAYRKLSKRYIKEKQ